MTGHFVEQHLPAPLLEIGPQGLAWWQWLAIPAVALLAVGSGWVLGWATRQILGHLAARTRTTWDDVLLERVAPPLTLLWAVAVATGLLAWLALPAGPERIAQHALRALTYLGLFWAGFRSIHLAFSILEGRWATRSTGLAGLLPLGRKIAKVALLAIGLVAVLNELGFQVASLLAGLGIGGLALALAAQKTVENLFGSVSIGVDQPFRVGDFVKIEDFVGTVEAIGMRSTRVRTLDRTIVTIPNGKLADMRTETFAPRDRIRLLANLGLSYGTTAAQMRTVLREVEAALRAHPKIWPDAVSVRFTDLRESTLNVEVVAWFQTSDFAEFTAIRQDLLLRFMEIVERAGTGFAFPTRTVLLAGAGASEGPKGKGPASRALSDGGADRDRTDDL
jgi:MscS family membrane protein